MKSSDPPADPLLKITSTKPISVRSQARSARLANGGHVASSKWHKYFVTVALILLMYLSAIAAERVYDCSTQTTAVATYSLDEVGACPPFERTYKNKTLIRAQILQRSGSQVLEGFICQLVIRREACYCSKLGNRKSLCKKWTVIF